MAQTVVHLDDRSWDFVDADLTVKDAFTIKAATGMNLRPFLEGLQQMDPLSLQGLIWFLRRPAEPQLRIEDVDFKIADLRLEQVEDAEDPTVGESPTPTT